jgi:hypothetical protein
VVLMGVLPALAAVVLAAGLAGRSRSALRPGLKLAGFGLSAAFFVSATFFFLDGFDWTPLASYLLDSVSGVLSRWLVLGASLAVLWIGLSAWRTRGTWGWGLVLAAGALSVIAGLPEYLHNVYLYVSPQVVTEATGQQGYVFNLDPYYFWRLTATAASQVALLLALAIGLRPVTPDGIADVAEPAPTEPPTGDSSVVEADMEVAGEAAGH